MIERTLILVKPDGVRRALTGEILARLERPGLKLVGIKMVHADRKVAEKHYTYEDIAVRHGEKVRNLLLDYITEGPVVAAVFEGPGVIGVVRKICGTTEPMSSPPGTIRGDYSYHGYEYCNAKGKNVCNVIHASANAEDAAREVPLWFSEEELYSYRRSDDDEHIF